MPHAPHHTKRTCRRLPAKNLFAAISEVGPNPTDQAFAKIRDVAKGGIQVFTTQPCRPLSPVLIRITIGDDTYDLNGFVRWSDGQNMGIQFNAHDPERPLFLDAFLSDHRERSGEDGVARPRRREPAPRPGGIRRL